MQKNEAMLIEQACRGNAEAFNLLMAQHEKRMYAAAYGMMKNQQDAEDCLQDAMLRVYRSISKFKGESAFSTWVYRITVNTCLDELRKRKKLKNNVSLEKLTEGGWLPPTIEDDPSLIASQREARDGLKDSIEQLPDDMRNAIVLRDIQGYSYEEISEILKINVGTVKSRISRARGKLRETIRSFSELFDDLDV